jgi:hypothetical protein
MDDFVNEICTNGVPNRQMFAEKLRASGIMVPKRVKFESDT